LAGRTEHRSQPGSKPSTLGGILKDSDLIIIYKQIVLTFLDNIAVMIIAFFITISLVSCGDGFEKSYYQKTTNIKFPDNYELVATTDNGEFMTMTILDLAKIDCKKFIKDNNFQPITDFFPTMDGLRFIDKKIGKLPDKNILLMNHHDRQSGKTGWTYIIDTTTCRLYCEIDYPDWGRN